MAGLVDYQALLLDLRGELRERPSWGRAQVLELIDELEQRHRVDESADAATLRHFSDHLTDLFLGLVPRPSATTDPLPDADRFTVTAPRMAGGAASDHPQEGIACPAAPPSRTSPRPVSRPAAQATTTRRRVPATI